MADTDIKLTVDLEPGDVTSVASTLQKRIKAIFDSSVGKELPKQFDNTARTLARTDAKANKLLKTIKELETTHTPEYNELQDSAKQIDTDLEKSKQKLVALNAQLTGYMQNRGVNSKDAVVYTDSWLRALDALRELKEKQQEIIDEKAEFESAFKDGPQEVNELVTETIGLYRQLQAEREKLESRKTSLTGRDDEESSKEFLALHNSVLKIDAKLQNTANDINDIFKMAGINANMTAQAFFESDEIIESFNGKIEDARQHLRDLKKEGLKFTTIENTATYENIAESIEETEKKVKQLTQAEEENRATREKMEMAGTDVVAGASKKEEYEDLIKQLQLLNNDMVTYASRAEEMVNKTNGVSDALEREIEEVERESEKIRALMPQSILDGLANKATQLADKIGQIDVKTKVLIPSLKAAGKSTLAFAKALTNIATGGLLNKIKRLGSSFSNLSKSTGSSNNALKVGFMTLLKYGLGIRSVYFLVKRLRGALGDGIKNLAGYSDGFNRTISQFTSALTQLKNSFATAFAPIIEVVAPILTGFINLVSEAVSRIGMLIAALTGKKTFVKAKAVQEDFADSMNHAASSTNSANSAAEKYKRTLAGFDDVEILKNPTSSGSSGGGSGGGSGSGSGVNVNDMFETVDIPTGLEDWAAKIKEAWTRADFTDLGTFLGEKIATALNNIPWDTVKQYAADIGKSFATFLNGLLSVTELATAVGKTIGEAINTIFTLANNFITNINAKTIGDFFADVMNKAINTIQFDLIADTLAKAVNKVFSAAETWANKFKFSTLGTKIKEAVKTALSGIEWNTIKNAFVAVGTGAADFLNSVIDSDTFGSIGGAIAEALNSAIAGVESFAVNFNSSNLGTSVGSAVNNFFDTFDFAKAGVTFGTVITKVGDALTTAISTTEWSDIGKDLTTFVLSIPWGDVFGTQESLAEAVSEGAGELLGGAARGIFEGIQTKIDEYFKEHEGETGEQIILGILGEIAKFLLDVATWPQKYIINPFVNGIMKGFMINSPAKEPSLLEAAGYVAEGFLSGIADKFGLDALKSWAESNIVKPFNDAVGTLKLNAEVALKKAADWAGDAWEALKEHAGGIKQKVSVGLEKAANWAGDVWNVVKGGPEEIKKTIVGAVDKTFTNVQTAFNDFKDSDAYKTVKGKIQETFTNVKTAFNDVKDSDAYKTVKGKIQETFTNVKTAFNDVKDSDAYKTVRGTVQKTFTNAQTAFNKVKNSIVTKFIAGSKTSTGSFDKYKKKFDAFKNDVVTKFIAGSKTSTGSFDKYKKKFDDFKDDTATKKIAGAKSSNGSFDKYKSQYNDFKDDTATKTIKGSVTESFSSTKSSYKELEDKKATITVEAHGKSSVDSLKNSIGKLWDKITGFAKAFGVSMSAAYRAIIGRALGGALINGAWRNIAQYATGGIPKHGTLFVAGESGAEAVGHIGGRTEVLNQSQMAAVMYTAVLNGTAKLTSTITNNMAFCTNSIIMNIGLLLSAFNFISGQMYDIIDLTSKLSAGMTDIVTGKVIPVQIASDNKEIIGALKTLVDKKDYITRDEMQDIIESAFKRYLDISLYVGDEQVARHANAGNLMLSRRYNTV